MRVEVLLSMQGALLDHVTSDLRAVAVSHQGTVENGSIEARFLYVGPVDQVRLECVSLVETHCIADFTSGVTFDFQAVPNATLDLLPDEMLVYKRWEQETWEHEA